MRLLKHSWARVLLWTLVLLVFLPAVFAGCAGTQTQTPPDCQNSWIYKTNFLPAGPILVRTALATAMVVKPEIKPAIIAGCLAAWKSLSAGDLAGGVNGLLTGMKVKEVQYAQPALVALSSLMEAGMINGQPVKLDACDLNVLKSLVKNIALDAGAQAGDFQ